MEPVTMEGCSYFKPAPSWDKNTCTLQNLAVEDVVVQGNIDHKDLKQTASLEACKQLHEIGALTDNLVQDIVVEEADSQESGNEPCTDEQPSYFPPELVGHFPMDSDMKYHCYLIELKQNFAYDVPVHDVVLIMRKELESDVVSMSFDLDADRGSLTVNFKYVGVINLSIDQWNCRLPKGYAHHVQTKDGPVCTCMLHNSLVSTPHNGHVYCITGSLGLNGNSPLRLRRGKTITYKKYYEERHGIKLRFVHESMVNGRHIFPVKNYLLRCRKQKEKESSNSSVELPPELCSIVMSPISIATFYTFSFVPSIMHRLESLLVAVNLKKMHLDHCIQNDVIPISKLTAKKEKIISNEALFKFGCDRKLPGFIRNEIFDPKNWIVPGDRSGSYALSEELLFDARKIYIRGTRKMTSKSIADVVEALIGAFLSTGGETSALLFMAWLGMKVDFQIIPYEIHFQVHAEKHLNVEHLESLLDHSFRDPSLLVEALTHGSYLRPEIPRCYQRLEFLGDSVLDYLMTTHFYHNYPGLSPGQLTDMRSASVNNECYALSAVKSGLHKHILRNSPELDKQIVETINGFKKKSSKSTFGWQLDTTFSSVLADVIESLAGAILVDSGYNTKKVFQSMRRLLEPLVTPETVPSHPAKELKEICQKEHYIMKDPIKSRDRGFTSVTIEVEAKGLSFKHTATAAAETTANKVACQQVLKSLKDSALDSKR
ncbi:hypothetical protein CJ030_MR1G000270 [Morella rubra]|uniref:Uncharacterized protein n=1 Tax=Morella rubra TaxID=262757 RepID=A0A6A1WXD8_9ROSI|nr:hypothetical protein CJ030_MR1G000270 [Morella rubra]